MSGQCALQHSVSCSDLKPSQNHSAVCAEEVCREGQNGSLHHLKYLEQTQGTQALFHVGGRKNNLEAKDQLVLKAKAQN